MSSILTSLATSKVHLREFHLDTVFVQEEEEEEELGPGLLRQALRHVSSLRLRSVLRSGSHATPFGYFEQPPGLLVPLLSSLASAPSLHLDLEMNTMEEVPSALLSSLLPHLTSLHLSNSHLPPRHAAALLGALCSPHRLVELALAHTDLTTVAPAVLAGALASVASVGLRGAQVTAPQLAALWGRLVAAGGRSALQELDLREVTGLHPSLTSPGHLVAALATLHTVRLPRIPDTPLLLTTLAGGGATLRSLHLETTSAALAAVPAVALATAASNLTSLTLTLANYIDWNLDHAEVADLDTWEDGPLNILPLFQQMGEGRLQEVALEGVDVSRVPPFLLVSATSHLTSLTLRWAGLTPTQLRHLLLHLVSTPPPPPPPPGPGHPPPPPDPRRLLPGRRLPRAPPPPPQPALPGPGGGLAHHRPAGAAAGRGGGLAGAPHPRHPRPQEERPVGGGARHTGRGHRQAGGHFDTLFTNTDIDIDKNIKPKDTTTNINATHTQAQTQSQKQNIDQI